MSSSKKDPLVTVLMAVHNDGRFVGQAIGSILEQDFADFEFLILDDASSDGSDRIVQQMKDPRIRLIANRRNLGLTPNLNRGISLSRGRYIARMDADDRSLPGRLGKQVKFLRENPSHALVGTNYRYIDETGHPVIDRKVPESHPEVQQALERTNQFAHSAVMLRKEALDRIGSYREVFRYAQDYDLYLRIAEKFRVHNLQEILVEWRIRLDSASVRYRPLQERFAQLARTSAEIRRTTGRDPLECPGPKPPDFVKLQKYFEPTLRSRLRMRNVRARSYFTWAFFFRNLGKRYPQSTRYFIRCLGKSIWANPPVFLLMAVRRVIKGMGSTG